MTDFPPGWKLVSLEQVADTALGKMLDRGKESSGPKVQYLRNVNVQWGRIDLSDLRELSLRDSERERFSVAAGDLLVCEGGEVGRCAVWRGRDEYLAYQKALHRIRPRDGHVDATYLRYLFEFYATNGVLARYSTGSTIAHLPQQQVKKLPVPLPPLLEQRRIVAVIEDHLSRMDAAAAYLESAAQKAGSWRDAEIDRALWSVLSESEITPVSNLLDEPMRNGVSSRAAAAGEPGVRTLTLTAVTRARFTDEFTKITVTMPQKADGLWLQEGDILVQRSNTAELVGTSARYDGPSHWAIFPDLLIRLRADESRISSRYLAAVLRSRRAHEGLRRKAKGLAGSMPKIDQGAVGAVGVPLVDPTTQHQVVQKVDEVAAEYQRLLAAAKTARRRVFSLRRGVLAAAFSGQLTGRGSDLDIAEELVEASANA